MDKMDDQADILVSVDLGTTFTGKWLDLMLHGNMIIDMFRCRLDDSPNADPGHQRLAW